MEEPSSFWNALTTQPGSTTTTLSGRFINIADQCGAISNSSPTGDIDLGGVNGQHDCQSGGGSPGNTPASRTTFYELNRIAELARGYLPGNAWLGAQLTANVNTQLSCGGLWNGTTVNLSRSNGGCGNLGELAGAMDHEIRFERELVSPLAAGGRHPETPFSPLDGADVGLQVDLDSESAGALHQAGDEIGVEPLERLGAVHQSHPRPRPRRHHPSRRLRPCLP